MLMATAHISVPLSTSVTNSQETATAQSKDHISPSILGLDIGGSLVKLAYEKKYLCKRSIPRQYDDVISSNQLQQSSAASALYEYTEQENEGLRVCLIKFETCHLEDCLKFITQNVLGFPAVDSTDEESVKKLVTPILKVTGGGAYKYRDVIRRVLGVDFDKEDEMSCLIQGCVFMLRNIPDELFYYDRNSKPAHIFVTSGLVDTFPFLLVNIGSGVSILKVESPTSYQRVGGTSIGGGTFWGISSLLGGGKYTFDELLAMADQGNHRRVDMLVRDIYGGAYSTIGLSENVIASSFGMAARYPTQSCDLADAVKSLLMTVSNNIGQLACLYAKQCNLTRILFGGFFIRGHDLTMEVITYAVNFWSAGAQRALFLRHEGYLGALGAYLKGLGDCSATTDTKTLWLENYAPTSLPKIPSFDTPPVEMPSADSASPSRSSFESDKRKSIEISEQVQVEQNATSFRRSIKKLPSPVTLRIGSKNRGGSLRSSLDLDYVQLDRVFGFGLEVFPLLESPANYAPDTWDLTQDSESRSYWLSCLETGIERHRVKAEQSQLNTTTDATDRSYQYAQRYTAFLRNFRDNPSGRGVLTVRSLLCAQQHFLEESGFGDPFCAQKVLENQTALSHLPARLAELAKLSWAERQLAVVVGLLGGNILDWGATEAFKFFSSAPSDSNGVPNYGALMEKVEKRPWTVDNYDQWIEAISLDQAAYRCLLIFCDNSGADILLGVLPFALEFIDRGSKVILAANSGPAINDVTFQELEVLMRLAASCSPALSKALATKQLLLVENGQNSPCLDLRLTASSLVQLVNQEKVDLIVIEGMGRAIHTNLYARFSIDSLKVAVIKNTWLANKLGGKLYGVVFKYERAASRRMISADSSRECTPAN